MYIKQNFLNYNNNLEDRNIKNIELLVIHCTELPDLKTARKYGEKILYSSQTGNSGHFYIDRNGDCEQWIDVKKVAHHVRGHNKTSIGIELVNIGRYPNWFHTENQIPTEPYPNKQIDVLAQLINSLQKKLASLKHIAGHEDLDTQMIAAENNAEHMIKRKIDPGPLFPWEKLMQNIQLINIGSTAKKYE